MLLDTNVYISREDNQPLRANLQNLFVRLSDTGIHVLVHPRCLEELMGDKDATRREIVLSKIGAYTLLESPPSPVGDEAFLKWLRRPGSKNDEIDIALLYAVFRKSVDFLITEDKDLVMRSSSFDSNKLHLRQEREYVADAE